MSVDEVKEVLVETLALEHRASEIDASMRLFGSLPQLDSLAVLELVTALEDRLGITFAEDELTAEVFDTLGSLAAHVDQKRAG